MDFLTEDVIKMLVALLAGGLIGLERETRDKAAGFRTIILISTGAALFTILSLKLGVGAEQTRIAANIVSGVGFLGAGVIFRGDGKVKGLTTAATIWIAAALGMGAGAGEFSLVTVSVTIVFLVLWIFPYVERLIQSFRDHHQYLVTIPLQEDLFIKINNFFENGKLRVSFKSRIKKGEYYICMWDTTGTKKSHDVVLDFLLHETDVIEFDY